MADQSAASNQGSGDVLSLEVAAESVAGTPGGPLVAAAATVPPACYEEQEVSAAVRDQSAATNCVQRVAAGVSRACPELNATVVKEPAAHDEPDMRWQASGGNIPTDLTRIGGRELTAAELLKQVEAERLQQRAISEEESKLLEEQIEKEQKKAVVASAIAAAVVAEAASIGLAFPKAG